MTTGYKNEVIYIHDLSVLIFLSLFYFVFPLAFIFFLFYMIIYFLSNEIDILARRVLVWNIFSLSCYDVVVAKFLDLGEYLMELFQRSLDDSHVWSCLWLVWWLLYNQGAVLVLHSWWLYFLRLLLFCLEEGSSWLSFLDNCLFCLFDGFHRRVWLIEFLIIATFVVYVISLFVGWKWMVPV